MISNPALLILFFMAALTWRASALDLESGFADPPETTKPWCYWYWASDNISREGITRDLEAMARVGIGEAFIGNVDVNNDPQARGNVKLFSEEWWQLMVHAIREGKRVGVNIGVFNCPGWSQSGGPWVKPEQSMRYVTGSETRLRGPQKFSGVLPVPDEPFQDIAVLAFPAPAADDDTLARHAPVASSVPASVDINQLVDGDFGTAGHFPAQLAQTNQWTVDLSVDEPFTARSLTLWPEKYPFTVDCELQAADTNRNFKPLKRFIFDRSNPSPNVGPIPYAPVVVSFPAVTAKHFRLVFSNLKKSARARGSQPGAGFAEVELSAGPRVERVMEKQLAKMWQTPLPLWDAYLWPTNVEPDDRALLTRASKVLNLTRKLDATGRLAWDVPPGDWIVLRQGMTPTCVSNAPASPEGRGLEIDKMNREWVTNHFSQFIGKLRDRVPPEDRDNFKHVVADSYEMGSQNWTDGFADDFKKRYGYDPLPWLPVLTGRIINSADESDRFLWDLRRLVADRISSDYVGALSSESRKNGMRMWLENYGHWGFPGEFLQYGGFCDDISGEYWTSGELGKIELRCAASAANIYGKPRVTAESWTSGGPLWSLDPWALRARGDWSWTEGINHVLLHVYIQQPFDDKLPGVNAWFGTEFNRNNTWFAEMGDWVKYIRRSTFLLQQGKHAADIAYYIGDDTPKMTGAQNPPAPEGRDFDYINGDVIRDRLVVRDGKFILPDGMSYRVLVLPPLDTMRPEVLKKIRSLVKAGGVVLGRPPQRSPSRENFPKADREVQKLAAEIWQNCDGVKVTSVRFGKGRVFSGVDLETVFRELDLPPDLAGLERKNFPWIHRTLPDGDIYFISNQSDDPQELTPTFRVEGRQPELWDAVTGEHRALPEFSEKDGGTTVPLQFAPRQSLFVVFRQPMGTFPANAKNFPAHQLVSELAGPWQVAFDPKRGGPAAVVFDSLQNWTNSADPNIKYYSGTAVYRKVFDLPFGNRGKLVLNLGEVCSLAHVYVNGQDLGVVWCAPWQVDVSRVIRPGRNELQIEVVNTWANRLIGDQLLPPEERSTWTVKNPFTEKSPLLPAGLIGPVTIEMHSY